jgi:hypothetical protein
MSLQYRAHSQFTLGFTTLKYLGNQSTLPLFDPDGCAVRNATMKRPQKGIPGPEHLPAGVPHRSPRAIRQAKTAPGLQTRSTTGRGLLDPGHPFVFIPLTA